MPRGMGRGYGRFGGGIRYRFSPFGGAYGLIDLLSLIGILYFLVKLFIVAAPYALGLVALLILRSLLRPRFPGWGRPF
ncbi:hypothetical protein CL1_1784 [Thermococcus cleftensis]|uniref:Uncharacterized protein n=1 Tax=Thermococcus cleftensis (strain DSM 27260 / KACC 17922 / CL1) TaxID=163003 RepID=I3ZW96_THECF|nr:hypothetical protein [Thermococcus cleftensis]AFL95980.1 hypothetical protein CL1_1784 [Thermococcus cleftensis]